MRIISILLLAAAVLAGCRSASQAEPAQVAPGPRWHAASLGFVT